MDQATEIRQKASAGDAHSQFRLARFMILGKIPAALPEEPMRWLKASCAQGYPLAMMLQASLSALGVARKQSYEDAIGFLAGAAATGDPRANGQLSVLGGAEGFDPSGWLAVPLAKQHFEAPRVFSIENFLSPQVCAWHIQQSAARLQAAPVKDPNSGQSAISAIRNNSGCGFSSIEADLVLQMTNLRIAAATGLPVSHQEQANILHYAVGQEYRPHYDFIREDEERSFSTELQQYGQRVVTCLIYLNDDFQGGETVFPHLQWSFKGRTGDALIFWNLSPQGQRERNSLHAGAPIVGGEKWLFSKWTRDRPIALV